MQNDPNLSAQQDPVVSQARFESAAEKNIELDISELLQQPSQPHSPERPRPFDSTKSKKIGVGLWLLFWLIVVTTSFLLYDLLDTLIEAYPRFPYLAILMALGMTGLAVGLLYLIFREVKGFFLLRALNETITLEQLEAFETAPQVIEALKTRMHALHVDKNSLAYTLNHRFLQTLQSNYTAKEVVKIYLLNVEKPLQKHARDLIQEEMTKVMAATVLMPYRSVQLLLLIYWSFRVVRKVCELYGLKLSPLARAKLIRILWENLLMDVIVDQATEVLLNSIGQRVIGQVLDQSSEALASGLWVYRMGNAVLNQLSLLRAASEQAD